MRENVTYFAGKKLCYIPTGCAYYIYMVQDVGIHKNKIIFVEFYDILAIARLLFVDYNGKV